MGAFLAAALVGVLHVHHAPSHDSSAAFEELLEAAHDTGLDWVVLTEHVEADRDAPLPAAQAAGVHEGPEGHRVLVLVGAEFGTADGHLIGLDIPIAYASRDRPGRELIARIHGDGGFAVVPHPFDYGGWRDLDAPFDAIEVHNNAVSFRRLRGPLLPLRLLRLAFDRGAASRAMLVRPDRELELWERMLVEGRRVVGLSGADAHQNLSILGWRLDAYREIFRLVRTRCPAGPLEAESLWAALRAGRCSIRYAVNEERAAQAREVAFPSGRTELQLDSGRRVLEIGPTPPALPSRSTPPR